MGTDESLPGWALDGAEYCDVCGDPVINGDDATIIVQGAYSPSLTEMAKTATENNIPTDCVVVRHQECVLAFDYGYEYGPGGGYTHADHHSWNGEYLEMIKELISVIDDRWWDETWDPWGSDYEE